MEQDIIGLRIKHLRNIAGMTQQELADKVGTSWEMISRYERGKSSPMRKIPEIADALNTTIANLFAESILEEEGPHHARNTVPFIDEPTGKALRKIKVTKQYYIAPDWIIHLCVKPFAVEAETVELQTSKIHQNGIIFVTQEKPRRASDLAVVQDPDGLRITPYEKGAGMHKVLGKVVAWEKRFE